VIKTTIIEITITGQGWKFNTIPHDQEKMVSLSQNVSFLCMNFI